MNDAIRPMDRPTFGPQGEPCANTINGKRPFAGAALLMDAVCICSRASSCCRLAPFASGRSINVFVLASDCASVSVLKLSSLELSET